MPVQRRGQDRLLRVDDSKRQRPKQPAPGSRLIETRDGGHTLEIVVARLKRGKFKTSHRIAVSSRETRSGSPLISPWLPVAIPDRPSQDGLRWLPQLCKNRHSAQVVDVASGVCWAISYL
jgi:hypothetical protein